MSSEATAAAVAAARRAIEEENKHRDAEHARRRRVIEAMTPRERRLALHFLSGYAPQKFDEAARDWAEEVARWEDTGCRPVGGYERAHERGDHGFCTAVVPGHG